MLVILANSCATVLLMMLNVKYYRSNQEVMMSSSQRRIEVLPNLQRRSFLKRGALIQFGLGVGMLSHGSAFAQKSVADTVKA